MIRLKDPLITLFSAGEMSGNYELSHTVLAHIHLILLKYVFNFNLKRWKRSFRRDV